MTASDARRGCTDREASTKHSYGMGGHCHNRGRTGLISLYRVGDTAVAVDCPPCGHYHGVVPSRRVALDEMPASCAPDVEAQPRSVPCPCRGDRYGHRAHGDSVGAASCDVDPDVPVMARAVWETRKTRYHFGCPIADDHVRPEDDPMADPTMCACNDRRDAAERTLARLPWREDGDERA